MKKSTLFIVTSFLLVVSVYLFVNNKEQISKKEYRALIENHPIQERLKLSKKERKKSGIPPNRYYDDQYLLEMNPATGKTNPKNLKEIIDQERSHKTQSRFSIAPGEDAGNAWEERGPNNIGGRTRVVFYDPNDTSEKRVFAGGVSGGLWVNNDITSESSSWSRVGIDENLSVSCYAIDPNDSNTWYVGTGESYTSNDGTGNGVWYTTDGGTTWSVLWEVDLEEVETQRPYYFNQIVAWNNNGTTELFFSIDGGVDYDAVGYQLSGWWKMDGNNIARINFFTPDLDSDPDEQDITPYVFSDVEIAPDNSLWCATNTNLFGRGGGKVFRTTDGENFTEMYSFSNGDRVELSVSKTDANKVYVLAEVNSGVQLVKTTDGVNFTEISKPNDVDIDISASDFARGQAFYNLTIEVDPENDDIVYAGGIDLFRSVNGGVSWQQISKWSNNNDLADFNVSLVHADHHAVAFSPSDANKGVFANDGGIYYANDLSSSPTSETAIVDRNDNYNITQFYSGAIGPDAENEILLGGAQDNGSLYTPNATSGDNAYFDIFGGDGAACFIDADEEYLIVSYLYNTYGLYTLPITNDSRSIEIVEDEDTGSFINIADLDDNLDILYTDGTSSTPRISRYTNLMIADQRDDFRKNFSNDLLEDEPTVIKVSPFTTESSTVFIGTETGGILKVTNFDSDTPVWTNIDVSETINTGAISAIDFGTNESEILVTLHNYGINNIYYTSDGGVTWIAKEGDFPDIPVKAIKMNPFKEKEVIIGTNLGVWKTDNFFDDLPTWTHSQNGMSNVKVTSFDMRLADSTVLASTYGRGLFTGKFTETLSFNPNETIEESIEIENTLVENGFLTVALDDSVQGEVNVIIYDNKGRKTQYKTFLASDGRVKEIKTPSAAGVYIVHISYEGKSYSKRIVVVSN